MADAPYDVESAYRALSVDAPAEPDAGTPDKSKQDTGGATWGDYGKSVAGGVVDLARQGTAAGQFAAEQADQPNTTKIMRGLNILMGLGSQSIEESLTPGGKRARSAAILPDAGQASVFEHPLDSAMMKLGGAAVPLAVMAALPESLLAQGAAGGVMQMGQVVDNAITWTNTLDDDELKKQSPTYKTLRDEQGLDEQAARTALHKVQISGRDLAVHGLVGAATMGVLGKVVKAGVPAEGALARAGLGAAEGGVGMGAASVDVASGQAQSDIAAGRAGAKPMSFQEGAHTFFNNVFEGGLLGAGAGLLHGAPKAKDKGKAPGAEVTDAISPPSAEAAALGTAADPDGSIAAAQADAQKQAIHNAIQKTLANHAETTSAEGAPPAAGAPPAVEAAPVPPAPGDQAAAAGAQGAVAPPGGTPPEVAAAIQRTAPAPAPEAQGAPPAPSPAPGRQVPPEVTAAAQRLTERQAAPAPAEAPPAPAPAPTAAPAIAPAVAEGVAALKEKTEQAGGVQQEPKAQLEAQRQQLIDGAVPAQFFPKPEGWKRKKGQPSYAPQPPEGMGVVHTSKGVYHFNPDKTTHAEVWAADKSGDTSKILGLGEHNVAEVVKESVKTGEPVEVVHQVTAEGTPVKEALAAGKQVPETAAELEKTKPPGGHVETTTPDAAVEQRAEGVKAEAPVTPGGKGKAKVKEVAQKKEAPTAAEKAAAEEKEAKAEAPVAEKPATPKGKAKAEEMKAKEAPEPEAPEKPRVLTDLTAEAKLKADAEAARKAKTESATKTEVRSEASSGPRTTKKQAELIAKGESVSTLHPNPGELEGKAAAKDRENANKVAKNVIEAATKEKPAPQPYVDYAAAYAKPRGGTGKAARENQAALAKARQGLADYEAGLKGEGVVRKTGTAVEKETKAATQAEHEAKAKEILAANPPSRLENTSKYIEALHARLKTILQQAKDAGVDIPKRVESAPKTGKALFKEGGETGAAPPPDHLAFLRTVQELVRDIGDRPNDPRVLDRIHTFMGNEVMARANDFSLMRETRAVEGGAGHASFDEARRGVSDEYEREAGRAHGDVERTEKDREADLTETVGRRFLGGKGTMKDGISGVEAKPVQTTTLSKIFEHYRGTGSSVLTKALRPMLVTHIKNLVGDLPVHIVTAKDMARLVKLKEGETLPNAYHDPVGKQIVIREDIAANREWGAHAAVHEAIHSILEEAIENKPKLKQTIRNLMDVVQNELDRALGKGWEKGELGDHFAYGLTDEHEFMSEALGNPHFQDLLSEIQIPASMQASIPMRAPIRATVKTVWQAMVGTVREVLGLPEHMHTTLEGVLRVAHSLERPEAPGVTLGSRRLLGGAREAGGPAREGVESPTELFRDKIPKNIAAGNAVAIAKDVIAHPVDNLVAKVRDMGDTAKPGGVLHALARKFETWEQFGQRTDHLFKSGVAKTIRDLSLKKGAKATRLQEEGNDLSSAMIRLHERNPEVYEGVAQLLNDATSRGFDPSAKIGEGRNSWLEPSQKTKDLIGKGATPEEVAASMAFRKWEPIAHSDALTRRYNELVAAHPDVKPLIENTFRFFEKSQEGQALGHIEGVLTASNFKGDVKGEAKSLLEARNIKEWREAVEKAHGEVALGEIIKAKALVGGEGPYSPLMRRGDFVVHGDYHVAEPKNAINKVGDDTWEFKTREEAQRFAAESDLHSDARLVRYDPETGERTTKEGAISHGGKGPGTAEERFAVTLQRKHVEYFEKRKEAEARREELAQSGAMSRLSEVESRIERPGMERELTSSGAQTIIKKLEQSDAYKAASDGQKAAMRQSLIESAMTMQAGNRIQSRRLPRRRVGGASADMIRNMLDYNRSQANYRAKLEFQPQIEDAIAAMRKEQSALYDTAGGGARSDVANEIESRARAEDPNAYTGRLANASRRLAMYSYVDRMARPSHLILHQTHLPMITAPIMVGRHGLASTYAMMLKTWKKVGGAAYKAGGKDFASSVADSLHKGADYQKLMKEQFAGDADAGRLGQMWDHLEEIGMIHPQAGVEVEKYAPTRQATGALGLADSMFNKIDTTFRHATNATEAINRYVGTAMAYRLEFAKLTREGKSSAEAHEAATDYARKILNDTQGFYSGVNAAPIFKNPWLRPFLQFQQFPQMMYNLLGKTAGKMFTGATREEKLQAAGSLGAILLTHTLMTGALGGIPTEGFKVLGLISKGMGLTEGDWSDVERASQKYLADKFGPEVANLIMHGPGQTMLGVDLHHRLGLNSFKTFGLPDEPDDKNISSFLLKQIAGAPYGLGADVFQGFRKMMDGDIVGGATKMFPLQALRDVQRAWEGGPKRGEPYTAGDTAKRLLGFTPLTESDRGNEAAMLRSQKKQYTGQRLKLMGDWADATPGGKAAAWAKIQKFNAGLPKDSQITMSQLSTLKKRRAKQEDDEDLNVAGVKLDKKTKFLGQRARELYPQE